MLHNHIYICSHKKQFITGILGQKLQNVCSFACTNHFCLLASSLEFLDPGPGLFFRAKVRQQAAAEITEHKKAVNGSVESWAFNGI